MHSSTKWIVAARYRFSTLIIVTVWKFITWIKLWKIGLKYYTIRTVRQDFTPFLKLAQRLFTKNSEVIATHSLIDAVDPWTGRGQPWAVGVLPESSLFWSRYTVKKSCVPLFWWTINHDPHLSWCRALFLFVPAEFCYSFVTYTRACHSSKIALYFTLSRFRVLQITKYTKSGSVP